MPTVFQTGERASRPLDPTRLYYTTAQKVADILQIPLPDPVYLTADSNTNATTALISASDYRHTGFEVGDSVEIASDVEMGETVVITAIARNGTAVLVTWVGAVTGDYDVADNAYIQPLQSFTNGKRKGVTKSQVETLIMRTQDKIDNLTNNSWRPMLQTAEYLNFDTYKPYRRRYYTDYVGSVPLLFRNVQQIMRLEIWQGSEYREIACAEVRLKVIDFTNLTADTDAVYLCPGGGGVATLTVGTSLSKFNAQFNNTTTAQQLSDLINKDLRRGKSAILFSPSFTHEDAEASGGTVTANLHHEFMASANADYGSAQIKVTSMRRGGAGETATVAVSDETGISVTGATSILGTVSSATSTTITLTDTAQFAEYGIIKIGAIIGYYTSKTGNVLNGVTDLAGDISAAASGALTAQVISSFEIHTAGSGESASGSVAKLQGSASDSTGSGTGSSFYYTDVDETGAVLSMTLISGGTGHSVGDVITLPSAGGTAPKIKVLSLSVLPVNQTRFTIDYHGGTTGDEARLRDWWCDYDMGIIYFNNTYPYFSWNAVKVTYVYGERYVEKAIEDICTKLVAMDLILSDDRSVLLPEGTQNVDLGSKYQLLKAQVAETLPRYVEVMTLD